MNKKLVVFFGVAALLVLGILLLMRSSPTNSGESGRGRSLFDIFSRAGGDSASSVLMAGSTIDYGSFMRKLRSGEVVFVWELWALRATCDEQSTPEQCDEAIVARIEKRLSSPEREQLASLFRRYFQYEAKMRELDVGSSGSFDEKYGLIKRKRRELLGAEDSQLVFGLEESQIAFADLAHKEMEASKGVGGEERVRRYEALKQKTFGQYAEAVSSREDKFANYQTELELRQGDFSKYAPAEREQRTLELQQRYFGKDAAKAIADARTAVESERSRLTTYAQREKEYLDANPGASDKEKQTKLRQIRTEVLGAEEAAAYERRRQFEESIRKIK